MAKSPKLKTLLILPSSALFLLMVAVLSGSAFVIYSSNVTSSSYRQMEATSQQVLRNYENYFTSAVQVSDGIYGRYANLPPEEVSGLTSYFDTLLELKPEILSIAVYKAQDGEPLVKDSLSSFVDNPLDDSWFVGALEDPYINVFSQGSTSASVPYSFNGRRFLWLSLAFLAIHVTIIVLLSYYGIITYIGF